MYVLFIYWLWLKLKKNLAYIIANWEVSVKNTVVRMSKNLEYVLYQKRIKI